MAAMLLPEDVKWQAALSKLKMLHDGLSSIAAAPAPQPIAARPPPAIVPAVERDEELARLKSANRVLTDELERVREMAERAHVSFATAQKQQAASLAHSLATDDRIASLAAALEEERGRAQHAESVALELEVELRTIQRRARVEDSLTEQTEALTRRAERESSQAEASARLAKEERRLRMQSEAERERLAQRLLELEQTLARVIAANGAAAAPPPDPATPWSMPHQPGVAANAEAHATPRHYWEQAAAQPRADDATMPSPSPAPPSQAYAGDYYEESPYANAPRRF